LIDWQTALDDAVLTPDNFCLTLGLQLVKTEKFKYLLRFGSGNQFAAVD
jgi:hypothetical protein